MNKKEKTVPPIEKPRENIQSFSETMSLGPSLLPQGVSCGSRKLPLGLNEDAWSEDEE